MGRAVPTKSRTGQLAGNEPFVYSEIAVPVAVASS